MKIYKNREGSHNMQCCCYDEVQRGLRARRQCLLSPGNRHCLNQMSKDSLVDYPSENKVCLLDSHSMAHNNVNEWASESIANPTVSN